MATDIYPAISDVVDALERALLKRNALIQATGVDMDDGEEHDAARAALNQRVLEVATDAAQTAAVRLGAVTTTPAEWEIAIAYGAVKKKPDDLKPVEAARFAGFGESRQATLHDLIPVIQEMVGGAPPYEVEQFFSLLFQRICRYCYRALAEGERCLCWKEE